MYVDRDKSPLDFVENVTPFFFPIHNADDWKTFRDKVQAAKGEYDVNARLYADVNAGSIMVGFESGYAYRGTFDGNGHTLTFNVPDHNRENLAPFVWVGNATIKNLHVAGNITSSKKFIGGLIGQVLPNANATVENCRSSVTINSSVNGDATNGGFVCVVNTDATVMFRNCKFDGSFVGTNCSHNGGYVGYANGAVIVDNCVFAPDHINTKPDGCQTWARIGTGSYTLINSYAITEYRPIIVIRSANDWTTFRDLVEAAQGQYDVDARLEADVNAGSIMVGFEDTYAYRGTFDGNGHTLTFNVYDHGRKFVGPFVNVGNATIMNLHTAGTITSSQMYATGLVAQVLNGTATIENCQSSVTVKGTMDGFRRTRIQFQCHDTQQ